MAKEFQVSPIGFLTPLEEAVPIARRHVAIGHRRGHGPLLHHLSRQFFDPLNCEQRQLIGAHPLQQLGQLRRIPGGLVLQLGQLSRELWTIQQMKKLDVRNPVRKCRLWITVQKCADLQEGRPVLTLGRVIAQGPRRLHSQCFIICKCL